MADQDLHGMNNVVELARVARNMRFPAINLLTDYWEELRGTRLMPDRSDIDPRRIEDALEYAFILERIAPGMARFRLAGMHLNDVMGMEVRGMPLTAFFLPQARKQISGALEQVFEEPARVQIALRGEEGIGRPPMEGALLLLPLKSDFGDVTRALGCMVTLGPIGRAPRRFTVDSLQVSPLLRPGAPTSVEPAARSSGQTAARSYPEPSEPVQTPGLAEDRAAFAPAPPQSRPNGRPHLYLVSSND